MDKYNKAVDSWYEWKNEETHKETTELYDIARQAERDMAAIKRLCEKALDNDDLELHHFYDLMGDIGVAAAESVDAIKEIREREWKKYNEGYEKRKAAIEAKKEADKEAREESHEGRPLNAMWDK